MSSTAPGARPGDDSGDDSGAGADGHRVSLSSATGRWVLTAAILGSGMALLDGTVVNVALPAIGARPRRRAAGLQWVLDGYLLTLSCAAPARRCRSATGTAGGGCSRRCWSVHAGFPGLRAGAQQRRRSSRARLAPGRRRRAARPRQPLPDRRLHASGDRGRAVGTWAGLTGVAGRSARSSAAGWWSRVVALGVPASTSRSPWCGGR